MALRFPTSKFPLFFINRKFFVKRSLVRAYDHFACPTMRSILMSLLVICFLLTYLTNEPAAAVTQYQPAALRVLTYNLLHDGAWSGFLQRMVASHLVLCIGPVVRYGGCA